jgi:hypothetical protein
MRWRPGKGPVNKKMVKPMSSQAQYRQGCSPPVFATTHGAAFLEQTAYAVRQTGAAASCRSVMMLSGSAFACKHFE